ncbi:hypothetical protein Nepgr_008021 [Nepenthes gracilis]|uniref:Uncharacterized protein n=1 Tax=Nepenthes gracilis TaxID=150966 RepID=A0AAD3XJ23_NEPGR|nr:hypothetical protein Nepgr_008021 [Nepenthes gracilis]
MPTLFRCRERRGVVFPGFTMLVAHLRCCVVKFAMLFLDARCYGSRGRCQVSAALCSRGQVIGGTALLAMISW